MSTNEESAVRKGAAPAAPSGPGAGAPESHGPIGLLVAPPAGAAPAGEHYEPTFETDYWRARHAEEPEHDPRYSFEVDFLPAYRYGTERRAQSPEWDDSLEPVLHEEWLHRRAESALTWQQARAAVREAWERADRGYRTYAAADRFHAERHGHGVARAPQADYDDYRPAYRYGTWARAAQPARRWDAELEALLARDWGRVRGASRLEWPQARAAVRDAWDHAFALPVLHPDGDGR